MKERKDAEYVPAAGSVIARQQPGTAKGFTSFSVEDQTGIADFIVTPDLNERLRPIVARARILMADAILQNQDGGIHVKAKRLLALTDRALAIRSHDFH